MQLPEGFDPKMLSKLPQGFSDAEQQEFELKMSKTIIAMPAEVQDRFKALKNLYVSIPFSKRA